MTEAELDTMTREELISERERITGVLRNQTALDRQKQNLEDARASQEKESHPVGEDVFDDGEAFAGG